MAENQYRDPMENWLNNTKHKLIGQMIEFLWQQWAAIGVSAQGGGEDSRVIDPEALFLVSSEFARYDARLFDEMLDWLHSNGNLINLKRVFNIRKQYPLGNPVVVKAIAKILAKKSSLIKWKTVSDKSLHSEKHSDDEKATDGLIELFPKIPYTEGAWQSCDQDFRASGLYRPPMELRGMSEPPSPYLACNLIFKMRALFGCNSRAEIMAWLLTHPSGHPAEIARDTYYFNKSIQATLNEMAASGLVTASRPSREKQFRINPDDWPGLVDRSLTAPVWVSWPERFTTIQLIHQTLNRELHEEASELFLASLLKETMNAHPFTQNHLSTHSVSGKDYLHKTLEESHSILGGFISKD